MDRDGASAPPRHEGRNPVRMAERSKFALAGGEKPR